MTVMKQVEGAVGNNPCHTRLFPVFHNDAFKGCTSLKNVTIPKTVERIGEYAFGSCTALEVVTMSENVTYIGDAVFNNCSALHTVKLSSKLREIGRWCFACCTALQQIELPSSLQILGVDAFRESGLVKITIPEVQGISGLFSDCKKLEEVTKKKFGDKKNPLLVWMFWGVVCFMIVPP